MSLSNNYPTIRPTLEFDFANVGALDPRITFTRATSATFVNQLGVIQTAASGIPRFDYDPSTLAAKGLLIEEQRTNLALYSEQFDNGYWIKGSSSVTANMVASPDGTVNADGLISAASGSGASGVFTTISGLSGGATYTMSCYIKSKGANWTQLIAVGTGGSQSVTRGWFNISTGVVGTINNTSSAGTIQNAGNGWYRCSMIVPALTTTAPTIYFACANGDGIDAFTNDGVSGLYIWGAQLEDNSFATSYIPTVASTVTRNADAGTLVSLSPWYNGTEGSFYLETNSVRFTNPTYFFVQTGVTNTTAFSFNGTYWGVLNENIAVTDPISGVTANENSIDKIAYSYGSGSASISVRASAPVSASRTLVPFTSIAINNQLGSAHLRRMAFYPKKLSDAQLQALTS